MKLDIELLKGRNVESKARTSNLTLLWKRAEIIADSEPVMIEQEDTYFHASRPK